MPDYIPKQDTIYQDWLANFITVATANLTALGLLSTDLTGISTDKSAFDTSITDLETKKAAMKAATQTKDTAKNASIAKARALVKRIQAKADVTNALKASLQITVPGTGPITPPIPFPPIGLYATIVGAGSYELTWQRNGNNPPINFIVEAIMPGSTNFVQIFSSTKTTYTHMGNTPGAKITYRVRAQHGESFSAPSNYAIVNDVVSPVSPV
ncbi:MAG: fibronectin type III domain-containing protein [Candidatus Kapabacteria bacterium]|nr:fibronectin type III domain-containing protein [Candidatus Kapabacteria bacterium]